MVVLNLVNTYYKKVINIKLGNFYIIKENWIKKRNLDLIEFYSVKNNKSNSKNKKIKLILWDIYNHFNKTYQKIAFGLFG